LATPQTCVVSLIFNKQEHLYAKKI